MAESGAPNPGRPRKPLADEIVDLLESTENRAMTLGMVTSEVDASRQTVKDRLDQLVESGRIESQQIGNAAAYWVGESIPKADGGLKDLGFEFLRNLSFRRLISRGR